ncbi:TPR-like protein [Marasmius fiardii PR-910]|nr:TPR-like protein [Marasmius fiardii PR-910]
MLVPPKPTSSVEFEQVLRHIQGILDDEQQRKELVGTKDDTAQQWLDLFQLLAEYPNVPKTLRPSIFKVMIHLSRKSGLHPQCLTIRGVEKLGDYPVGGGAFGDVWKGRVGQQLVCLKVVRAFNRSDVQQVLKDYMQEGIVWRQLNHPNVLPFMGIYYLDKEQRQLCLVSPWMEQGNLVEFLKNCNDSVDRVLLAHDVARGLSHLHEANIVHGDLKGVNVLVTPDLRACIGDFGLSRVSATQLLLSETSRSKGTTRWLSPELLRPTPNCVPSKESDVYAYGCVCYEVPFHEFNEAAIVFAVLIDHKQPSRPESCPQLRDSIWDLMEACWKETPSHRPVMIEILARIHEMNEDSRLKPASNWSDPSFTQIWNDAERSPIIQAGETNAPRIGAQDNAEKAILTPDEGEFTQCANFDREIVRLRQLLAQQEGDGEAWKELGYCYLMQDDLQKAYSAYQQALYLLPNPREDPKLWYGIGILYDRYGSLDHAEEAFSSVLRIDKDFDKAKEILFRLGIIYKQQGKYEESLQCFDRILRNSPSPLTQADIWYHIGHVYEQRKDYTQAKNAYERVLAENAGHAKALQQFGWLYHQDESPFQNQDLAIRWLTKSVEADSSDALSWYLLGRTYMAGQKYNEAYQAYQQAVYRDGRNPTFWCSIGVLYFRINQFRDALDAYSRAIKINPYIPEVWFDLGLLYESCGNPITDAIDAYARASELNPSNSVISERLRLLKHARTAGLQQVQAPAAPDPQDVHPTLYRSSVAPSSTLPEQSLLFQSLGQEGVQGPGARFRGDSRGPPGVGGSEDAHSDYHTRPPPGPFRGGSPPPVIIDEGSHMQIPQLW